jgi:hypothetical protein
MINITALIYISIINIQDIQKCRITSIMGGPGGSMSYVVGLPNNSYKPITNTAWVHARLCKLQKGCTRLAAASDKVYQLLGHDRWFSPGTPASSTTKICINYISIFRYTTSTPYLYTEPTNKFLGFIMA